jgi:hypothetical protein
LGQPAAMNLWACRDAGGVRLRYDHYLLHCEARRSGWSSARAF